MNASSASILHLQVMLVSLFVIGYGTAIVYKLNEILKCLRDKEPKK